MVFLQTVETQRNATLYSEDTEKCHIMWHFSVSPLFAKLKYIIIGSSNLLPLDMQNETPKVKYLK